MATIPAILVASVTPTPPIPSYPAFYAMKVPEGSDAVRAYRGYIRPFSDDETARRVLRSIVADQPLKVLEGRLDSEALGLPEHALEPYLLEMAKPCTVVVLEFEGKRHPQAYLVDPVPDGRVSNNHHVWWRQKLLIDGELIPRLCIYSANQFSYDPSEDRLPQFLNQVAVYIARHLIFLRTRMLHLLGKDRVLRRAGLRKPWQLVNLAQLNFTKNSYLYGTWVGPVARHGPDEHLLADHPDGECYCNSGELYRDCHMKSDQSVIGPLDGGNK